MPLLVVVLAIALTVLLPVIGNGQGLGGGRIDGNFNFLPLPYIDYDRSLGFQYGALPMAMFNPVRTDTVSPSSVAAMLAMKSTNDTWFLMGFFKLFLDEDNWRLTGAGGRGSYNFQFFVDSPVDTWFPYNTAMDIAFLQVKRRIHGDIYGGVSYVYLDFDTTLEAVPGEFKTTLNGLGLVLSMDRRSNVFYPLSGFESSVDFRSFPEAFGNEATSERLELEYNHFVSMRREEDVLAGRFYAGLALGEPSFNQQLVVGQVDIRGYTQGAFRGNYVLALQGEYRWNFYPRWGAVGFLGVATVFDAINEDDEGKLLPGIGTGFRFTVDTDTHMNMGLDVAAGVDDWGVYFRIGEAF